MDEEIKVDCHSTNAEKIQLFKSLFFGRQDVFARRFENAKNGTSGYSTRRGLTPVYRIECIGWRGIVCARANAA